MALFFVSYDLRNARNYQALHDELKKLGAVRMLESCWCLKRSNTTEKECATIWSDSSTKTTVCSFHKSEKRTEPPNGPVGTSTGLRTNCNGTFRTRNDDRS